MIDVTLYLHNNNIVHRDIKLQNMLITDGEAIQFIDFGFSKKLNDDDEYLKEFCGTPNYIAPEILKREKYSPKEADIWALGVSLFKLLTGKFPFDCIVICIFNS